jgi:signal recognition particle subunit SRP54
MRQVREVVDAIDPREILFVADAMTGQDAVRSASGFMAVLPLTGIILTKTDGDARGGAALTVVTTTGKPIKFVGVGEKPEDFEPFHPDRMASRILGMGDVLTLVEKAEQQFDEDQAAELERKIRKEQFTLDDFLDQLKQIRKMGPLSGLLKMIPGVGAQLGNVKVDDRELDRLQAIITSMTPEERANPQILNGSRRRRIARGSGTSVQAVNQLVKQFSQMKKMMRQLQQGKMPSMQQLAGGR